jgi:hypothetical protein
LVIFSLAASRHAHQLRALKPALRQINVPYQPQRTRRAVGAPAERACLLHAQVKRRCTPSDVPDTRIQRNRAAREDAAAPGEQMPAAVE